MKIEVRVKREKLFGVILLLLKAFGADLRFLGGVLRFVYRDLRFLARI